MATLDSALRNQLSRIIVQARQVTEAGAHKALESLAVHHHEPYASMAPEERTLRNKLRAHGRQLGDTRDGRQSAQSISRLVQEVAYQHWHLMLFARFLAENNLLLEPSHNVPVSLEDCKELARGNQDPWALACEFAQRMLPEIFRSTDPSLAVDLPPESRSAAESLLSSLPPSVFESDDALGWVYQFWQSRKKDEVNASGDKITGDTLPAVTQLFTEHYMVQFLLHNTIGAWHAGKVLAADPKLAENAKDEEELRRAVALKAAGGYSFTYLRFVRGEDGKGGPWRPAAGTFSGWPKIAAELKVVDPCCGSGHFLVAVFALLLRLRMEEEGLSVTDAADAVLRDNIYGLELDARCTQIAAFNLALAAWRRGGYRRLPSMHIACSGLAPNTTEKEWVALAGNDTRLRGGMERLYQLFQKAPVLGSLINPRALSSDMLTAEFHELQPLLEKANPQDAADDVIRELAVAAHGIAKAAEILAGRFMLVVTNVPYLGRGKQNQTLKDYCSTVHPKAKTDIATCFVERCLEFCAEGGTTALVTPHSWLFLGKDKQLRQHCLQTVKWEYAVRLGPRAFETIGGEVVNVVLVALTRRLPRQSDRIAGIDVFSERTPRDKDLAITGRDVGCISQADQLRNPDACIQFVATDSKLPRLSQYTDVFQGVGTTDNPRFVAYFWELPEVSSNWDLMQLAPKIDGGFSGYSYLLRWEQGKGDLAQIGVAHKGLKVLGRAGFSVAVTRGLYYTRFLGTRFDSTIAVLIPRQKVHSDAIGCFLSSKEFKEAVRSLDQALSVTESTFVKVPFDLDYWQQRVEQMCPDGLPEPHSVDPTQWIFSGKPEEPSHSMHVAVARLLNYRWPRQTGLSLLDCPSLKNDNLEKFADEDGIVCIPSVRGESPAADRLGKILAACKIKPDRDLDDWLRNEFFTEHCKLFYHRPFIWHVWDGRKRDGFHALVNYHKLAEGDGKGRRLLETLTYSYLGEWIKRQRAEVSERVEGADGRLDSALKLEAELKSILNGAPPYDIFVRWKPLSRQSIGWDPDVNDGVRANIRPFLMALDIGRKGAGILRWKPNIKWTKDRGTEPPASVPRESHPWFWGFRPETAKALTVDFMGGAKFDGTRWNDLHYTIAAKKKARS